MKGGLMDTIGSFDAKTHLPELLRRVEQGESITITKHGKPVARLVPVIPTKPKVDVKQVVEAMLAFRDREGPTLGEDLTIRDLIEEGRR
jgi:prevent-host-death family protein